jgi:hypothetical protein
MRDKFIVDRSIHTSRYRLYICRGFILWIKGSAYEPILVKMLTCPRNNDPYIRIRQVDRHRAQRLSRFRAAGRSISRTRSFS